MPNLPNLHDLPPEALARLRALNPELGNELQAPAAQEQGESMESLEVRMRLAEAQAWVRVRQLMRSMPPPVPEPPAKEHDCGMLVFKWAAATVAFIYIFIKAGAI